MNIILLSNPNLTNPKMVSLIPTFRRTTKIERQNTEESIGYDVTNRNIASLQCPILTPMTYGHERMVFLLRFIFNINALNIL